MPWPKNLEPKKQNERSCEKEPHGVFTPVQRVDQHEKRKANQEQEEGKKRIRPQSMRFLAPTMATYGFCAKDADPVEACELSTLSARQASEFFQVTPLLPVFPVIG